MEYIDMQAASDSTIMKEPTEDFYPFGLRGRKANIMPMSKPHRHLEVEIFSMEDGPFTRKFGDSVTDYEKDEIAIFWGCISHQLLDVTAPGKGFIGYIPLNLFLNWEIPGHFTQAILSGQPITVKKDKTAKHALLELQKWLPPAEANKAPLLKSHQLLIQGFFLQLIESAVEQKACEPQESASTVNMDGVSKVSRMIHFIVNHFKEPIQAKHICDHVKLNNTYGRNLFQKSVGITMRRFLTDYRIDYAKNLLATTDRVVLDIALESGFGSVGRFHAAFKTEVGMAPHQYRQCH